VPRFVWDPAKEAANIRSHSVGFVEAASVFEDRSRLEQFDEDHSGGESRYVTVGWSSRGRLLVVITSERDPESPRIISARRATKRERDEYTRRT
jgi:uncharacterized DUF497 family protein